MRVTLERGGEDHISQRQPLTPKGLWRFFDSLAQLSQQRAKPILLVSLRSVVGRPFLAVDFLYRESSSLKTAPGP